MNITSLSNDQWIAIIAIIAPIFTGLLAWLWLLVRKHLKNKKIKVIEPTINPYLSSLNKPVKALPFLDESGKISVKSLKENHRVLFQSLNEEQKQIFDSLSEKQKKVFESLNESHGIYLKDDIFRPGEFRDNEVVVFGSFKGTKALTNLSNSEKIDLFLSKLIEDWNKKVRAVKNYSTKDKIEFISRFHIEFELIHPFLDGNGRIGRGIMEEQIYYLFGKIVKFDKNEAYGVSMNLGTRGDESMLRKLIYDQLELSD